MKRRWWAGLLGLGVYLVGPYLAVQVGHWGLIREGRMRRREVALTFDDGPDPLLTPAILDALREARASATFFVVPERAEAHRELIGRMLAEGHQVEAHAEVHRHAWTRTPWGAYLDPIRAKKRVQAVTGQPVTLHRPAHGAYTLATLLGQRRAGVTGAHWSIEAHDWHRHYPAEAVRGRLNRLLQPGAVIVLHDAGPGAAKTVELLPDFLSDLKKRGYVTRTLAVLDGAQAQDWGALKRRAFMAFDRLFDRLGGNRPLGGRVDNLFRIGEVAFPLRGIRLNDGSVVPFGAKAIEFHVNNPLLVDLGPRRGLLRGIHDFGVLAHELQVRPEWQDVQYVFCLSALSPLMALGGYETHDLPAADARRLRGWANVLRRAYGSQRGAQRPRLSILAREAFIRRFERPLD
ncbi:polysaccharide deacetylase family protein [Deinococcus cavernae]|nr:polysaccharide deacetylase family protein [Deinococcus cavernae]